LGVKCSYKFKNCHIKLLLRTLDFSVNLWTSWFSDIQSWNHRNVVLKLQEVFPKNGLEAFQAFLILQIWRKLEVLKNKQFCVLKKINDSCLILVRWVRFCFKIYLSTSESWDNPRWIFQSLWKCPLWGSWERRDHKVFYEFKVYVIRGIFDFKSSFQ
jgi:hypothetical protein